MRRPLAALAASLLVLTAVMASTASASSSLRVGHLRRRDGPLRRARPGLPAAREHRRPPRPGQPLVVGPRDPGRDPEAAATRRPERPGVQLGHVRPDGALRDRQRDAAGLLDPRDAAVGERGEGLERRPDECPRPAAVRGRGPASLQRHVRQRGRRHPAAREPLDGVERAEQPRLPQAAVPSRRGTTWTIQSGRDYAKMCNAIVQGIKSIQRTSKVACGGTAPRGNNNPNSSRPSVSPLPFARAMKAGGAAGFRRLRPSPVLELPRGDARRRSRPASAASSRPPSRSATSTRSCRS